MSAASKPAPKVINLVDDDDEWAILDEMEAAATGNAGASGAGGGGKRKNWLPEGMEPVLEELPKWFLLADVLHEIEEEMMRRDPVLGSRMWSLMLRENG